MACEHEHVKRAADVLDEDLGFKSQLELELTWSLYVYEVFIHLLNIHL